MVDRRRDRSESNGGRAPGVPRPHGQRTNGRAPARDLAAPCQSRRTACRSRSGGRPAALSRGPSADELAHTLWDLPAIDAKCRLLLAALDEPDLPLPAMMMRAAAVVRFLREEPLLPRSLTPDDWRADELRERYRDLDRTLGRMVGLVRATLNRSVRVAVAGQPPRGSIDFGVADVRRRCRTAA